MILYKYQVGRTNLVENQSMTILYNRNENILNWKAMNNDTNPPFSASETTVILLKEETVKSQTAYFITSKLNA